MKRKIIYSLYAACVALIVTGCNTSSSTGNVPPSQTTWSMSIVTPSIATDTGKGTDIIHIAVHTLDENGQPLSNLPIKVALVNGAARSCYYEGSSGQIRTTAPLSFVDPNENLAALNIAANDTLIVLPTAPRQGSSYLGDWKITKTGSALEFGQDIAYNVETTDQLHYVIGNEKCLLGRIKVAHVQFPNDNNSSESPEDKGLSYFDIVYDKDLEGKAVAIGVHVDKIRQGAAAWITLPSTAAAQ